MMNFFYYPCIALIIAVLIGCHKTPVTPPVMSNNKILVDATKDGGGWWAPQTGVGGYNANTEHQGKKLASYLKTLGYQVDELPRGGIVTSSVLKNYNKVIRAGVYGSYSSQEITAYDSFLSRNTALLLIADYLRNNETDPLSEHLGIKFEGMYTGLINRFDTHPVTNGVSGINYIAGSSVTNYIKNYNINILGWYNSTRPVMGTLNHPGAKIFFIGDINGIEEVPQPFVNNLVKWLF